MTIKTHLHKFIFSIIFCLVISFLHGKNLSYFIKKHNLPDNLNVLVVHSNDCVNCYYGFSSFIKNHITDLNQNNFIFLFSQNSEEEINNIFKYRLSLEKKQYPTIIDSEFYALLINNSNTSLVLIENKNIKERYTAKDIQHFKSFVSSPISILEVDTINLKSRFGTKNLKIAVIDEQNILICNNFTNEIYKFDLKTKQIQNNISISNFISKYDSLLKLVIKDTSLLNYNLKHYKTAKVYTTFPLCKFKGISSINGNIYIALGISYLEPVDSTHNVLGTLQAIVKMTNSLQPENIYVIKSNIDSVEGKYISLINYNFLNDDTVVFSASAGGDRGKDSVAVLYSLSTGYNKIFPWNYEPFMPTRGKNGYFSFYNRTVFKEKDEYFGYFSTSPFIYNLSTNQKVLLQGLNFNPKNFDIQGKDKYFYVLKILPLANGNLVIASINKEENLYLHYSKDFKSLITKKTLFNGYFDSIFKSNDKLFALENYSEKEDKAILHIYKITE